MAKAFRKLTMAEFDHTLEKLRVNTANADAARRVMVNGLKIRSVADEAGISENMLSATVRRIWSKYIELSPLPEGWDRAIIEMPKDELKALQKKSLELKNKALEQQAIKAK